MTANRASGAPPTCATIVDWYHAADRLKQVVLVAWPAPLEREAWLEAVTTDLWEGRVTEVIRACEPFAARLTEAH